MKRRLVALLSLLLLLSSGCWSRREMNDLGVVIVLGVDLTEDGLLEVTLSVAQPAASTGGTTGGQGGQTGQQGGAAVKAVVTRVGRTLSEAIREAELVIPRRLSLQHAQVIILGERFAETGVDTLLDYLLRNPQVRLSTRVLLLRGSKISELIQAPPIVERLQGQVLRELVSGQGQVTRRLKDLMIARSSPYQAPVLPVFTLEGEYLTGPGEPVPTPELTGVAVFKDDRIATYIEWPEARGIIWLTDSARGSVISLECPDDPGKFVSVQVQRSGRKIRPVWRGSQLGFDVTINGTVHILETQCHLDLMELDAMSLIKQRVQEQIKQRVESVIKRTQAFAVDPVPFGEYVRSLMPRAWDQVGERWPEVWAKAPVRVEVDITLRHVQATTKVPNWRAYPPVTK